MKTGVVIFFACHLRVKKKLINHLVRIYLGSVICLVCFDIQFVINELVDFSVEH
jgi:hypothetical protein